MSRALVLALTVLAMAAPGASAAGRLDRLAAALRHGPVAVDLDLSWMIDTHERRAIAAAMDHVGTPVKVAVLPQLAEDESGGDAERIVRALHARVGDAIYVIVDQYGHFRVIEAGAARRAEVPFDLTYPPVRRGATPDEKTVGERLIRLARLLAAAPPATPEPRSEVSGDLPRLTPPEPKAIPTGAYVAVVIGGLALGAGLGGLRRRIWRRFGGARA